MATRGVEGSTGGCSTLFKKSGAGEESGEHEKPEVLKEARARTEREDGGDSGKRDTDANPGAESPSSEIAPESGSPKPEETPYDHFTRANFPDRHKSEEHDSRSTFYSDSHEVPELGINALAIPRFKSAPGTPLNEFHSDDSSNDSFTNASFHDIASPRRESGTQSSDHSPHPREKDVVNSNYPDTPFYERLFSNENLQKSTANSPSLDLSSQYRSLYTELPNPTFGRSFSGVSTMSSLDTSSMRAVSGNSNDSLNSIGGLEQKELLLQKMSPLQRYPGKKNDWLGATQAGGADSEGEEDVSIEETSGTALLSGSVIEYEGDALRIKELEIVNRSLVKELKDLREGRKRVVDAAEVEATCAELNVDQAANTTIILSAFLLSLNICPACENSLSPELPTSSRLEIWKSEHWSCLPLISEIQIFGKEGEEIIAGQ